MGGKPNHHQNIDNRRHDNRQNCAFGNVTAGVFQVARHTDPHFNAGDSREKDGKHSPKTNAIGVSPFGQRGLKFSPTPRKKGGDSRYQYG